MNDQHIEGKLISCFLLYPIIKIVLISMLFILAIITLILNDENEVIQEFCISQIILCIIQIACDIYHFYVCLETSKRLSDFGFINREGTSEKIDCEQFFLKSTKLSNLTLPKFISFYCALAIIIPSFSCFPKHVGTQNPKEADYQDDKGNYQINVPAYIQGQLIMELAICNVTVEICIWIFEFMNICFLDRYYKAYDELYLYQFFVQKKIDIQKTQRSTLIFCAIFMFWQIFKSVWVIYILAKNEYSTALILIVSNLMFSALVIFILSIVILKLIFNYTPSINSDAFVHHIILIDSIILNSKVMRVLFLASLVFCLILTIVGAALFQMEFDNELFIIKIKFFLIYDCFSFQIALIVLLILKYFYRCYNGQFVSFSQKGFQNYFKIKTFDVLVLGVGLEKQRYDKINILQIDQKACILCKQPFEFNKKHQFAKIDCQKNHLFHNECIKRYLERNQQCPMCLNESENLFSLGNN